MPEGPEVTRRSLREGTTRRGRTRRIRAVLAAGLVLGIGSTVTLAAWQDQQQAHTTITASTFKLEGSTDGSSYHRDDSTGEGTGTPAQLDFGLQDTAIAPGDTVYALFSVRTTPDSTVGGTLWLTADEQNAEGLGQWLNYAVSTTDEPQCESAEDFDGGKQLLSRDQEAHLNVAPSPEVEPTLTSGAGSTVNYCFEVTLPESTHSSAQGQSLEASWSFHGQSE